MPLKARDEEVSGFGSLRRRLSSLEEQSETSRHVSDVSEKKRWLSKRRRDRRDQMPKEVWHARDLIGLFRRTGPHYPPHRLREMSAQDLADRILAWRPVPEDGCLRPAVEREVAVYEEEEGLVHMACPPQWAESFDAGEELEAKYVNIPDSILAAGYARILKAPGVEEEQEEALEFARTLES